MMLKQIEVYRISFRMVEGQIVKEYEGILLPKDYEDIEIGLASVIDYILQQKKLPMIDGGGEESEGEDDNLFTIIFKKDVMNKYYVETLATTVGPNDLENILSGLMFMQVKLHMEKMATKKIKINLKHENTVGVIDFSTDSQLI